MRTSTPATLTPRASLGVSHLPVQEAWTSPLASPPLLKRAGLVERLHWEDGLWVLIVGALATLWVILLMSPAWH